MKQIVNKITPYITLVITFSRLWKKRWGLRFFFIFFLKRLFRLVDGMILNINAVLIAEVSVSGGKIVWYECWRAWCIRLEVKRSEDWQRESWEHKLWNNFNIYILYKYFYPGTCLLLNYIKQFYHEIYWEKNKLKKFFDKQVYLLLYGSFN